MFKDDVLLDRKIRRLEKRIESLYGEAYHAYWNIGNAACVRAEDKIKPLERELVALERSRWIADE
jgi:hypothetical protein